MCFYIVNNIVNFLYLIREGIMAISRLFFIAVLIGMSVSNAVIEKYDPARDMRFIIETVLALSLRGGLSELNKTEIYPAKSRHIAACPVLGLTNLLVGPRQQETYVAREGDNTVGFITWRFKLSHKGGTIFQLAVSEAHRTKGHGTALVRQVLDRAQEHGLSFIMSSAEETPVRSLLGKMGFRNTRWADWLTYSISSELDDSMEEDTEKK